MLESIRAVPLHYQSGIPIPKKLIRSADIGRHDRQTRTSRFKKGYLQTLGIVRGIDEDIHRPIQTLHDIVIDIAK